ncbi:hypothetical protein [Aquabacterium sp.]|uniref:hypothetical protein n=1 Tax=Aquabacterium sp. TaxID=1872578 RepID=UPI002B58C597|nr:hypothetical protein [Aquabacterium sp.]HSW05371.1 hypothetical protein [Aquabacterium sp.]
MQAFSACGAFVKRVLAGLLWLATGSALAATLVVGPPGQGPSFAQAVKQARDGDTIEVLPGDYRGDVTAIDQRKLSIRGRGQRPVFLADGRHAEGKAIWIIRDGDITIENIEFRGARVPDRNGAGLRFEKGRLTVRHCAFFDNENGILTANFADAELRVEDSVFGQAPRNRDALHHLLYVGRIGRLSVTGSRFHDGYFAHLIKSRARESFIAYNLLADGPNGHAAYEVDLPNGGEAKLIGNVIWQSANTSNLVGISYGAEGQPWPTNALYLAHNTLISDATGARFVRVWDDKLPAGTPVHAVNNLSVGIGVLSLGTAGHFDGNYPALAGMLVDIEGLAFALAPGSLLRGRGVNPRLAGGPDLSPHAEFKLPVGTQPLAAPAQWTPGAFQR